MNADAQIQIDTASQYIISAIPADYVEMMWPTLEPHIQAGIDHSNGELDILEIRAGLMNKAILGLAVNRVPDANGNSELVCLLTLEKRIFPSGKKVLNVTTAGGKELNHWKDKALEAIYSIGREHEQDEVYIVGRQGWARELKKDGFKHIHTVIGRPL